MIQADNILKKKVSLFKHKCDNAPMTMSIKDILVSFKSGTFKQQISEVRACNTAEEYSIKKSKLPAVTFCGEFSGGHSKANLASYNELMILDIDKVSQDELLRIKCAFTQCDFILTFWESPSQNGIKAIAVLQYHNPTVDIHYNHKTAFEQIAEYLSRNFNIILDKSGSDVSRLCFVSHDENLVIKDNAGSFEVSITESLKTTKKVAPQKKATINRRKQIETILFDKRHKNPENKNKQKDRLEVSEIIKYLKNRSISITESYDDWFRVGYAIANSFDCELGKRYYLELCQLDGVKHDENASLKMLSYCYDNSQGNINLATIIYLAQQKGYHKREKGGEGGSSNES